jgi:hypothetical protein
METKRAGFILFFIVCVGCARAQSKAPEPVNTGDSLVAGTIHVERDWRIEVLGKKMAEYNESLANKGGIRSVRGYRLMLLSTSDRNQAMAVRSKLLQQYPDQSVYMAFQSPYIKLKFGNFTDKAEAERYRKQITGSGLITNNIYVVSETVQVKVDKNAPAEE